METRAFDLRRLGRSGLSVLPLGLGTNKWGKADPAEFDAIDQASAP